MSDLNLGPSRERSPLLSILIAVAVVGVVVTTIVMLNPRETAEVSVQKVALFAPHTEFKPTAGGGQVVGGLPQSEDDLYVVATVRITDKLRLPLFLNGRSAKLISASLQSTDATVVSNRDLPRLEETFPQLAPMAANPLTEDQLNPGETREGVVVLLFPGMTQADWHNKVSSQLTLDLQYQSPITVALR